MTEVFVGEVSISAVGCLEAFNASNLLNLVSFPCSVAGVHFLFRVRVVRALPVTQGLG